MTLMEISSHISSHSASGNPYFSLGKYGFLPRKRGKLPTVRRQRIDTLAV